MFKLIFIIVIICLIIYCVTNKVHIRFDTFLQPGFKVDNSPFGIFCYWAKQGSGKTMGCVDFLLKSSGYPIYANLKSLKGIEYNYFSGLNQLLEIGMTKTHCIIFFDEIFRYLGKDSKLTPQQKKNLKDFLCQMRKRRIIFITTCQEWLDMPIEFRRYVRRDIQCSLISILGYPILIKKFYDTTQIKWSDIDNEYVSPILGTYVEHGRKRIINSYDTLEVITDEEIPYFKTFNEYNTINRLIVKQQNKDIINTELEEINKNENVFVPALSEQDKNNINFKQILKNIVKSVKHTTRFLTTTIRKRVVSCQFTNKKDNFTPNNTFNLHTNSNSVDNDFWDNYSSKDIE